jgi:hypothetical protein
MTAPQLLAARSGRLRCASSTEQSGERDHADPVSPLCPVLLASTSPGAAVGVRPLTRSLTFEGGCIAERLVQLASAQHATHDFAGARLGQGAHKIDGVGRGDRTNGIADVLL